MRHQKKTKILDRKKEAREMMLRNLAASVLLYENVATTLAKAKTVRSLVEKAIGLAKRGDLTARRQLISLLPQKMAVKKSLEVLGERYKERAGGYTRIIKIGSRAGDGAALAKIELVK